ncbi:nucleotidyl transferase AbiEii/AbiGii toxin family protein [Variovorax sp. J31P207]|uniref:nucleotidyl transferase AbiEii/AbiGii toxin family protein n=1 Tax=Variovorax sp. J31P207 TaxID=3053510 RepID=UPI0025759035|nr:nucleotidyl transferase AbiEii/AbiGii toxin family protein [Variovorax sp. J31P207]MDM0067241.1 nucleotidyl transferase AbiEii/AbiGii toxin family protein [Variovorax sp. J31P207]
MFERPHHRRIGRVLQTLDGSLLRQRGCLFGGGTAIALRFGEYRESLDIDFLVSDLAAYRELRQAMTGVNGWKAITRADATSDVQPGELRADQYGIRTRLLVEGQPIKFEVVFEARIALERPGRADELCGVPTLTSLDMGATKLLANSDRWADDGVFSRDLIDLAMMKPALPLLRRAVAKAEGAYGDAIRRDLQRAIDRMGERAGWLERCVQVMGLTCTPAQVWQRVRSLRRVLI